MATVYLARDPKHNRPVAIKVLRPELSDLLGRERFLREIEIAAGLQHSNILPLYDSGVIDALLYYVMPYVEGESLRDRLDREQQLPLEDAVRIAREVAEALSYAHSLGIVHRDIKPANILLSGGRALVADFGIARAITAAEGQQLTERGIAVGTPAYMSPEQASGQDRVDGRTDLYALGCVLYEMLAGEPPFSGRTTQAIIARHLQERPPSLHVVRPTVPPTIQGAIETVLAKVPADRFPTASSFADALLTTRERRARVPRSSFATGVVVAAVLAVGAAGLWLWQGSIHRPLTRGSAVAPDPTHIAVLYFEDLSEGAKLGHVAAGLTEDLIDELSGVPVLHVISPDGVRSFRGKAVDLDSVAHRLGVGTLVTGSIAESQGRLRVVARLTDPATGVQLLSQSVERPQGDVFAIQDEITEVVSRALRLRLGKELQLRQQRSTTKNVAAWNLVQRASELREDARTLADNYEAHAAAKRLWQADSLLTRAEALDRRWVVPILARGEVAFELSGITDLSRNVGHPDTATVRSGRLNLSYADWLHRAVGHAERAFALRPEDARVLELRGFLRYHLWVRSLSAEEGARAERDLQTSVARDPSRARAWFALSEIQRYTGRFAEADQTARRAFEADAYFREAPKIVATLFFNALNQERFPEAQLWCDLGRRRFSADQNFIDCDLRLLGWSGTGEAAITRAWRLLRDKDAQDPVPKFPAAWADRRMMVAAVIARSGLADSARAVIQRARLAVTDDSLRVDMAYAEAYVRLLAGERDEALRLLMTYLRANPTLRDYVAKSPWFRPLASDPRFRALVGPSAGTSGRNSPVYP